MCEADLSETCHDYESGCGEHVLSWSGDGAGGGAGRRGGGGGIGESTN